MGGDDSDAAPVPARLLAATANRYAGRVPGGQSAASWASEIAAEGPGGLAPEPETASMSRSRLFAHVTPLSKETERR